MFKKIMVKKTYCMYHVMLKYQRAYSPTLYTVY